MKNAKRKNWSVGANISVIVGGILGFEASAYSANKIASAILGNTVSHSSLRTGISLSATQNNYLTHE